MSTLAIPKIEETAKEQELAKEINALAQVPFPAIQTEDHYLSGIGLLESLKQKEKTVHLLWDEDIEMANKLHKSLTGKREKFLDAITACRLKVDSMLSDWRKRKEQERLTEERRLAAIAQKQQADEMLAEAAQLEKEGDVLGAQSLMAEAINAPAPVVVAASTVPKVAGSYTREVWKWRIKNQDLIPREFMVPDKQAIGALVRAKHKLAEKLIPGIEVYDESRTVIKS